MICVKCRAEIADESLYCRYCGKKQVKEVRKATKRANGTGTVYKLSGKRRAPYVAVVSSTEKQKQQKTVLGYFQTKTEALNALDAARINPIPDGYNLTLDEIYESWSSKHYEKISQSTENSYKAAWLYLKPYGKIKMRTITSRHIQAAIDDAVEKGKSLSTCSKIKVVASSLCRFAMKDDIINKDYAQFVILPEENKKEKEVFSTKDIELLWKCKNEKTAQIILVLIYTGVRINELFSMEMKNVYVDKQYMVGGSKTDAGKDRIIPIHQAVLPFVKQWIEKNKSGTYLLPNARGGKTDVKNFRTRQFYPLLKRIGILSDDEKPHLTPHSTRHTFISEMVRNSSKPEYLQRIVGHEQYNTTIDLYTHITNEDINSLISEVNQHVSFCSKQKKSKTGL